MEVYNAVVVPMMAYGCESWVLREKEKAKLQATEMNVGRTDREHLLIARSIKFTRYRQCSNEPLQHQR